MNLWRKIHTIKYFIGQNLNISGGGRGGLILTVIKIMI